MPDGFDNFKFIVLTMCKHTNFVFAIPTKERDTQLVSDALIHRVFIISGPPQFLSVDKDRALTGQVISTLLQSMNCSMQIISPWNHGSSKAEQQIQTIGNMITKHLIGKRTRCCDMGQNDTIGKIELKPSFILSSEETNCKNDIQ